MSALKSNRTSLSFTGVPEASDSDGEAVRSRGAAACVSPVAAWETRVEGAAVNRRKADLCSRLIGHSGR